VVALVARLAPVKGIGVFLDALAEVRERDPAVRAFILGEAWEGQAELFRQHVSRLKLEGAVAWLGRRTDVERWLSVARLGVVSSLGSEMQSRATMEYLASGLPVVATRVGVLPEWLEGKNFARLVHPGVPSALAAAMLEVLALPGQAPISAEARLFAEDNFSPGHFVTEAERRLARALEAS
jgi:glycosyltransferase involved in cell wall biosynthesis